MEHIITPISAVFQDAAVALAPPTTTRPTLRAGVGDPGLPGCGGRLCNASFHQTALRPSLAPQGPGTRLVVAGWDLGPRRAPGQPLDAPRSGPRASPPPPRIPLFWRGGPRGAEAPLRRPPGGRRAWGAARRGGAAAERGGGSRDPVRFAALARSREAWSEERACLLGAGSSGDGPRDSAASGGTARGRLHSAAPLAATPQTPLFPGVFLMFPSQALLHSWSEKPRPLNGYRNELARGGKEGPCLTVVG